MKKKTEWLKENNNNCNKSNKDFLYSYSSFPFFVKNFLVRFRLCCPNCVTFGWTTASDMQHNASIRYCWVPWNFVGHKYAPHICLIRGRAIHRADVLDIGLKYQFWTNSRKVQYLSLSSLRSTYEWLSSTSKSSYRIIPNEEFPAFEVSTLALHFILRRREPTVHASTKLQLLKCLKETADCRYSKQFRWCEADGSFDDSFTPQWIVLNAIQAPIDWQPIDLLFEPQHQSLIEKTRFDPPFRNSLDEEAKPKKNRKYKQKKCDCVVLCVRCDLRFE